MNENTIADAVNKAKEKDKVMDGMADNFKDFMTSASKLAMQITAKGAATPEEREFIMNFTRFSLDMLKGIFISGDRNAK